MKEIELWTDGGCNNKTGIGAWAFVAVSNDEFEHQEVASYCETTSNRMEMMAAISALKWSRLNRPEYKVTLCSDSRYLLNIPSWAVKWKENGWRSSTGKSVKNQDLVKELLFEVENANNYSYEWIPGHDGIMWNEHADQLATIASKSEEKIKDSKPGHAPMKNIQSAADKGLF